MRPHLAATDWEQCTRFETRLCPVPQIASIGHGHIPARTISVALLPGMWEEMTSFAIFRDPLERFVSAFFLLNRDKAWDGIDALDAMKRLLADDKRREHVLLSEQASFVCDAEGQLMVNVLGLHSKLSSDLAAIFERVGLPPPLLPRVNAAPYPPSFAPDAELRELVEHHYAADYALGRTFRETPPQ
ncbi:sulfotransferase family 2 domain-containing protein [Citromicrobium bathyomarinum]|uniref:sulfotransferase family 2 domain-containing protein n=1 Tax=Citromicrobium bathyomarinum TaxID=72174 RepID=UPI00315AB764